MNSKDIEYIAHLARIKISPQDIENYQDLNNIIDLVSQLNEIDTHDIEPMTHPLDLKQPLRTDVVTETNQRQNFQALAKDHIEAGVYLVPKVIDIEGA